MKAVPPSTGGAAPAPDISVIIVSWNAAHFLEECLESLGGATSRRLEIIVVDNASSDGSAEMVARCFPSVILIETGANLGFARANNIGIAQSRGRHVALINSDVKVLPGCLDALAAFLDGHPDVGMVGPRLRYGDGRQQSSCRHFPTLWNNACEVLRLNRLFPRSEFFSGEHMFHFGYDRVRDVDVLVGCFVLARRTAIEDFGLLDEGFFMYGEDVDWSHRCRRSGWRVAFYPGAESIHYGGGSSANDRTRFEIVQYAARRRLWAKHRGALACAGLFALINLQCGLRLGAALAAAAVRRPGAVAKVRMQGACLRALWQGLADPGASRQPGRTVTAGGVLPALPGKL